MRLKIPQLFPIPELIADLIKASVGHEVTGDCSRKIRPCLSLAFIKAKEVQKNLKLDLFATILKI